MNAKLKHLELIQGVINRLSDNSFRIKGWSVVLLSAIFFLLAREGAIELIWVGIVPIGAFWVLDGYFLWQERLFRALYDHVRGIEDGKIDFSMNISRFKKTWRSAIFSRTLILFYGALALSVGVTAVIF